MVLTQLVFNLLHDIGIVRFHTTMVLTQLVFEGAQELPLFLVSIPLWFSRNAIKALKAAGLVAAFPYHYGSHATRKQNPHMRR